MSDLNITIGQFKILDKKIDDIKRVVSKDNVSDIITRDELCQRLKITEATCIKWEKKGKIKSFRIGPNVRYNWPVVIAELQNSEKEASA